MTASYHDDPASDADTDIGTLWQEALIRYYEECGTDLRALPLSRLNIDHIKAEQEHQLQSFASYRHDGGKLDKLRSLIATNSDIVIGVATHIANAASAAFPPSAAILTAFNYVMTASRAMSEDYDMIVSFFDIMNSFLERVSMLESRMPAERPFRRFLVNVFSAMMTLSAIARKCRLKGRLSRWAKALIDGSDPKLKGAFDGLHMHLQRFESVAMLTTLKHTLESGRKLESVGRDVKLIHAGVEQNIILSQQSYALGLESKGYIMDAATTSHDILTVVTRQEERGAEYTAGLDQVMKTLNKLAKADGPQDQVVDAGSRKSIAMHTLETLLEYNLDDKIVLADLESLHVHGTCSWFRAQSVYSKFEAGDVRLLWVSGPAGMGKSTLAYTVVRALQEGYRSDTTTSVAHFFFREEGDRVFVDQMLRSCALQIASRDTTYREEAVAEVKVYEKISRGRPFGLSLTEDHLNMWELLFQARFTKKSGRRLVLVLDGVDDVEERERQYIEMFLEVISRSEDVNIRVLLTSDPKGFAPDPAKTKAEAFELTKELMLSDTRAIITERLKILDRLRKLPQRAKTKIVARLSRSADTMRYVDHMLRRLNQLGLEVSVMRQLNNLPSSTTDLYRTILNECQKARTEEEIATLKAFFAWLAYIRRPLFLTCARRLLRHIAADNCIDIDEELEYRCARLLHLSNVDVIGDEEDQDDSKPDSESDDDKSDDDGSIDGDENNEVGFAIIGFREKGLRSYFRPVENPSGDRLRTSASSAHVMILETMRSILCSEADVRRNYQESVLQSDAARGWGQSLQAINLTELSEEEAASVIESICSILSNRGGSIRKIERHCRMWDSIEPPCVLGSKEESIQETLACIQTWAARTAQISPSLISRATATWMRPIAENPESLFIKLAEAHVTNWFASDSHANDDDVYNCFMFAHYALYLGREHPAVQQNEQLKMYFAGLNGRADSSGGFFSEESFVVVSRAFPRIEMTGKSYLSISRTMDQYYLTGPCLGQLKMAIRHADTDVVSMEIYARMAGMHISFARRDRPPAQEAETCSLTADDPMAESSDELGAAACRDDGGEETVGESKETRVQEYDQYWAKKALEALTRAAKIASSLPESSMEDTKTRDVVRSVWAHRAYAELMMGVTANVVDYCKRVMHTCRKGEWPWNFDIPSPLAKTKDWATFLDVVKVLSTGNTWFYLGQYTHEIHIAAKATGEVQYVLEQYRKAVPQGCDLFEMEISLLIKWADFCCEVVGTAEATSEAKTLLNRAIDAKRSTRYVAGASFRLSDILLAEFRGSTDLKKKIAVYDEMKDLVSRVSESMGAEFDPSQSQTVIPLAHMARKLDAVEFQRGLERTFEGCVAALTDETGWNDRLGMTVLARVLAIVGLEREAQIAATCQIYVLNMEIHMRENDWRFGSDHDKSEGGESIGEDDVEARVSDVPADSPDNPASPSASEKGEVESEEGREERVTDGKVVDGDLGGTDHCVTCKTEGCNGVIFEWSSGPVYLCYYCAETHLCQKCFDRRAERIAGKPGDDWHVPCPEGHKHIRIPVPGWKGLTGGVFKVEDTEVSFREWLAELKEKEWPEAWERFWTEEQ